MRYFLYCRKSTESEDRQVLSIDSQFDELRAKFGNQPDIEIIDTYRESFSAKAPGRTIFTEMLERIKKGHAEGIIAWHPDRLARNSMDGGTIIYLLDQKLLKDLKFATYSFENSSQGKFMLSIIFGYSKYYVDSLSENVKRGYRAKLKLGWRPNVAPLGYLNDKNAHTIVSDPARFPLVRRLFDLALTGNYSLYQLRDETLKWDLRTISRQRTGGKHLAISAIHRILRNPFYAGLVIWNGETHAGAHEPMITLEELDRVKRLRSQPEKQAAHKHVFAFTGFIRCGECGCMVTAEKHVNRFGSQYTYYRCTKKRAADSKCGQRYIQAASLTELLDDWIGHLGITDSIHAWVRTEIASARESEGDHAARQQQALQAALNGAIRGLSNVTSLRVRELISEEEFMRQRRDLQQEEARVREQLRLLKDEDQNWLEPTESLIWFGSRAVSLFREGDDREKRDIVRILGSNPVLKDKILSIQARKPFIWLPKTRSRSQLLEAFNQIRILHVTRDPEYLETLCMVQDIIRRHSEASRRV